MKKQNDALISIWNKIWKSNLALFKAIVLTLVITSAIPNESIYAGAIVQDGGVIKGNVKDTSGEVIIGATVVVKGTTIGTITDVEGNYTLSNVPANSVILFSFIGLKTQETVYSGQGVINVVLEADTKDIDEVVVVGYGTVKKTDLTGSVSTVSPKELTKKGAPSMMESLQGQVPGVSITQSSGRTGGGFDIAIRGNQSIGGSSSPLYVIDGIVVSDIQMLNPADIERIDVLKDASSAAIYGSRASNGVVIVTTKSGKGLGGKTQKPVVSYDGYVGTRSIARMPDFMNGIDFMKYRFARYTLPEDGSATDVGSLNYGITAPNLRTTLIANYLPEVDGNGNYMVGSNYHDNYYDDPDSQMSNVERMMMNGEDVNWRDYVTRNGFQQNHFVNVSGASENVSYHFGFGYQQDKGVIINDQEDRFNIKAAIDAKVSDHVTTGISLNLARTENDWGSDDGVSNAFRLNPYCAPYDSNGELVVQPGSAGALNSDFGGFTSSRNPMLDIANTTHGDKKLHILGNLYVALKPFKDFQIKSTFSPNLYQGREHLYQTAETDARASAGTDYASVRASNSFDWTWDNQVNYSLDIEDHSFGIMGLFSMNKYTNERFNQYGEDFPANTSYYNMGTAANVLSSTSSYTENSLMSYAARLNYSYKGKYLLTATVRADGSSRFSESKRWGSFPSAAVAWRASEESFMKQFNWLSNLKLRLSYGTTGSHAVGNYDIATMPSSTAYYAFGSEMAYGYGPNGIVNRDIMWEKTKEVDFGFDMSVFNQRISLVFDAYNKLTDGILMNRSLPVEAGGGAVVRDNIGKVRNKGIELSLRTINVKTNDWQWETTFSFAKNKNEIEQLYGDGTSEDIGNNWWVGEPVDVFYNYTLDGIVSDKPITVTLPGTNQTQSFDHAYDFYYQYYGWYEGMPIVKDRNNDGEINSDDESIIGHAEPDWTGSFSTSLRYKNIDLGISLYTKQNYMVRSRFLERYQDYGDRGRMHINMDYYIPAGTPILLSDGTVGVQESTHYGKYAYPNNFSGAGRGGSGNYYRNVNQYVDASYTKIKNITLGYTLPSEILDKVGISYLRVYTNITNPFVFSDYKGFDPEWASASLSNGGPSTVTYQFGVNVRF
ncbi:SusC/RagA family TonB-linked outer membrane protein [Plebeiibacterium sediminum]|uniref:TonB-dependent receptor n=1 Tax=Plebeiibacterium sediminum TaxID=2992112 RepID=A0AAE3SEI9_9BACT|nr:TonB-dependent receptor [Plebeiobacterium sediminum]MCW3786420.1 TonB-dependent receptor [Plebeiobacterium sediminum]